MGPDPSTRPSCLWPSPASTLLQPVRAPSPAAAINTFNKLRQRIRYDRSGGLRRHRAGSDESTECRALSVGPGHGRLHVAWADYRSHVACRRLHRIPAYTLRTAHIVHCMASARHMEGHRLLTLHLVPQRRCGVVGSMQEALTRRWMSVLCERSRGGKSWILHETVICA